METSKDNSPLFVENDPECDIDHDEVLKNLGMVFTPHPYQRSLATQALKGMYTRPAYPMGKMGPALAEWVIEN